MTRPIPAFSPLIPLLAAAFALAEGMQLLRSALAGLSVYLGQVQDVDPPLLGGAIIAIFLTAFTAPLIPRLLAPRRAFLVLALALALLRLAEQFATQPDLRLALALTGVAAWLWLLPLVLIGAPGAAKNHWQAPPVVALLTALLLDTALKGAFATLDLSFTSSPEAQATTVALTLAQLALILSLARTHAKTSRNNPLPPLRGGRRHEVTEGGPPISKGRGRPATTIAPPPSAYVVGPALALHLLIFQNIAQHTVLTGWSLPAAFAWTLTANLIAIWLALTLTRRGSALPRSVLVAATGVLAASVIPGLPVALVVLAAMLGPLAIALLLVSALGSEPASERGWLALALGLLIIPIVLFGWYAHYEMEIPIPQWIIPVVAAALLASPLLSSPPALRGEMPKAEGGLPRRLRRCLAVWSGRAAPPPGHLLPLCGGRVEAAASLAGLLLMLLPLYQFIAWSTPRPPPADLYPLRVATYNIHQGFDLEGRPGLEQIARAIEAQDAHIVGLQEVPRGWLVNGGVDALSWLAQRLEMHTAWGPAADPFWGNAILSRYPIISVENRPMPNNDELTLDRAFLTVEIDTPGEPIQVVITHLHHIEREPQHRLPQVQALVDGVNWSRPTILLGDLNAQPHHREIRILTQSGLVTSESPLPTFPADRPRRQIDYILTTDHFEFAETWTVSTTASDHLPLVAVLVPRDARER